MTDLSTTTDAPAAPGRAAGPRRRRRLRAGTVLALLPVVVVLTVAVVGPWIAPLDPTRVVGAPSSAPGGKFLLGTDNAGLDVFSRVLAGARIDVVIATLATLVATTAGIAVGLVVGMNESRGGLLGFLARSCARGMDLLEAVPTIIVALVVVSFFGTSTPTMVLTLAIILAPLQARLVRTEVLRVRHDAYLDAGRQAGLTELELVVRHVLPNSVTPAFQNAPVLFGVTIILTAALGFLGVGLPPPTPEWGAMITRGAGDAAVGKFWAAGAPALALCLTVAAVSLFGRRLAADLRR
ncbi:ABC transporter permease [Kineococcus rhizosphaerae]|uniref:Peptide/nickel transport system permease protein n=1 Tax=Kineococcus rhizosphaerae TaxID=559628 RepID=A0A2T0QYC8_9ACTN|nr:ABC transporter permease [Kineococcus rhizosphaerae]PRY11196.1 peptide/nickel transport system permease protein [Kineococcus rhizosphaerae]